MADELLYAGIYTGKFTSPKPIWVNTPYFKDKNREGIKRSRFLGSASRLYGGKVTDLDLGKRPLQAPQVRVLFFASVIAFIVLMMIWIFQHQSPMIFVNLYHCGGT